MEFTWTIDGLWGWDMCTLVSFWPRSNGLCFGISIGICWDLIFVVDDTFCVEIIGWKADEAVRIRDDIIGCGLDFNAEVFWKS